MKHSFNSLFEKLIPLIPGELADKEVISGIRQLNEFLPVNLAATGGMEFKLAAGDKNADWFLGINSLGGGREVFAECMAAEDLPPFFYENPSWKSIRNFATQWADPESPLNKYISFLWLEFDYSTIESGSPIPCVFLQAVDKSQDSGQSSDNYDWLFEKTLNCFSDKPIKEEIKEKVRFCLDKLPDGANSVYTALMLGRKIDGVRLVLSVPASKLESYLNDIGWQGSTSELLGIVNKVSKYVDLIDINIDVSDRVHSKIGLECILKKKQLRIEPRWKELIGFIVEESLCTSKKADGLLSWPGYDLVTLPHEDALSYIFRGISHIKLVYQTGKPIEAKGYIGFRKIYQCDVEEMTG